MKIKTNLLTGSALDWAVAMCEGATEEWRADGPFLWRGWPVIREHGSDINYSPSSDWAYAGPIIDREGIDVGRNLAAQTGSTFVARLDRCQVHPVRTVNWYATAHGPTRLLAAMRCYVASKLGDEVEVPDELVGR